jgi:hypothetical protein
VNLEQIAAQLEAEADGADAHADPVVRAMARRLRIVASEVDVIRTTLTAQGKGVTLNDNMSEALTVEATKSTTESLADELYRKTGLRVRGLHVALTTQDGISISHETLNNIFRGKKNAKASPAIREAVLRRTGIVLP